MKPVRLLLILGLPALSLTGCPGGQPDAAYPRKIVAVLEGGSTARLPLSGGETDSDAYLQSPKIALRYGERLVQVLTTNLDADKANEQVIIVRSAERAEAPLMLLIADFDSSSRAYARSFEAEIGAADERTVRIDCKDLIGNHGVQVITSGLNRSDQATLDAFRSVSPPGALLRYASLCRLESDGSIEIDESDRGAGYSGGHRFGASFPIVAYRSDPEAGDASVVIRDTYAYNYAVQSYGFVRRDKIAVQKAGNEQLAALLQNGTLETLKKHIKGIWHKADELGKSDEKILAFDPETEDVAFFTKDVQEVYKWKFSRRSFWNTLQIFTESALLKSVQPAITVVLVSPTEMSVSITEFSTMEQWLNEQWGGTYVRLTAAQAEAHGEVQGRPVRLDASFFRGRYDAPNGAILSFASPRFSWQEGGKLREGGFTVTDFQGKEATQHLLSLKIVEDQGLTITDLFYLVTVEHRLERGLPVYAFTLKPAKTSVYGILDLKGQPIRFTRRAD